MVGIILEAMAARHKICFAWWWWHRHWWCPSFGASCLACAWWTHKRLR
jgi:hypothetical protein